MNEQTITLANEVSFKDFLFKNKRNRTILMWAGVAVAVQFAVFKYLYPFASYIHGDSFSYLKAADQNLSINTYLIGYSKFLRLFSVFAKSDFALVAFQYIFIQCSVLFLLFTLFYFYKPGKVVQIILLCFMVFNPLFLHLANLVSSDGFFLALSTIWFSLLLWIIHEPSKQIIIWHTAIIFIAFTVRYNAMIYPLISTVAFCISKLSVRKIFIGLGASILLCGLFVSFTTYRYKQLTGQWQYSPFSGWQLANNAMYTYRYVSNTERKDVPKEFQQLDKMIRNYFDTTRNLKKHPTEEIMASTYYMWSSGMPLMKYKEKLYKSDTTIKELKKWASMGPLYKSYGLYIIRKYPLHFAQYFLWPNANKYFAPPVEFLEHYNSGKDNVSERAQDWFGYKSINVSTRTNNEVWILDFYPILSGVINLGILCLLICYIILQRWQINRTISKGVLLGSIVWALNAGFTIFASSPALRFQAFPIILTTIFVAIIADWMVQIMNHLKSITKINNQENFPQKLSPEALA
jgi:hypothetical protein